MTAKTPGSCRALEASILLIIACGSCERRILQKSRRGSTMSSANLVCPVHFARASTLRNGLPITFRGLPFLSFFPFLFVAIDCFFHRLRLFATHSRRLEFDRFVNFQIARAATEIAGERFFNLIAAWLRIRLQKFFGDEQEARRAVAALCRAEVCESFLQWMK